jgi:O-antigen/teichoic acid export membrane protein
MPIKKTLYQAIMISTLSIAMTFGFKIYLSHIVSKETLALFYTTIDVFSLVLLILVGFRSSMVVAYAKTSDDIRILMLFRYVIIFVVLLAWSLVLPYLKHKMGVDIHYWYLVAMIVSMGLFAYLSNQIAMYREYALINKSTYVEPILMIAWFCIAYYIAEVRELQALFISTTMASFGVSSFIILNRQKRSKEPLFGRIKMTNESRLFMKNSVVSTLEFGSGILMMYLAVFLIIRYFTIDDLGDFQVVVKPVLMALIALFVFPIFRFILPELSKLIAQKEYAQVFAIKRWIYTLSLVVSLSFIAFMILFGREFTLLLFPEQYANAYLILTHLAFFFIFIMLNAYQISFIKASGGFKSALLIRLSGIAFFLISFFLIYNFYSSSVISVIFALMLGYLGMFIFSLVEEKRYLKHLLK